MLTDEQIEQVVAFDRLRRVHIFNRSRRCLRYNLIVPHESVNGDKPDVSVVHVAVRLNRGNTPLVKDVVWHDMASEWVEYRDIGYHYVAGWSVYWDRRDYESKAVNAWIAPKSFGFGVSIELYRRGYMTFENFETVNPEALKGTRYEHCQYRQGLPLVDWLRLYREEPGIEMLAKMGFENLCTPAVAKAMHGSKIRGYLRQNAKALTDAKYWGAREFLWAARRGVQIEVACRHFAAVDAFRPFGIKTKFDYDRVWKMLPKWNAHPSDYVRYLGYAKRAGLDMECEGVLYPPAANFHERIDRVEKQADRIERAQLRAHRLQAKLDEEKRRAELADLMVKRAPEIERFQASLDKSAVVDLGAGVKVLLAKSQSELRDEGKRMGNCVGCGRYGEGIVRGNTLILMFKVNGKSYCDAEISREDWTVRQVCIRYNQPAPKEYRDAAEKIAKYLKRLTRKRKKVA